ncbi:MAG: DUF167 domain-containing protein [Verrucomicrobia bacterium]|nr:DUF167 domain-containing protein [Verrucomicrobiota bacterium]MDA1066995.1 DUF167 domain-containing protein [Verrucomicrobiota bacterium]
MKSSDCVLAIKVVPNASKSEIGGWLGTSLKIRLQAVPEDGKANKALITFLSAVLKIERKQIVLESGQFSPQKRIRIIGLTRSEVIVLLKIKDIHG